MIFFFLLFLKAFQFLFWCFQKRRVSRLETVFGWKIHHVDATECLLSIYILCVFINIWTKIPKRTNFKNLFLLVCFWCFFLKVNLKSHGMLKWLNRLQRLFSVSWSQKVNWVMIQLQESQLKEIYGVNMFVRYSEFYVLVSLNSSGMIMN